jgi:hypothetical protein
MNYRLIFCLLLIVALVGVVSADTLIVYPSGAEDGQVERNYAGSTFTQIRTESGSGVSTTAIYFNAQLKAYSTTDQYSNIQRGYLEFNTSAIPDTATIDSAVVSAYSGGYENTLSTINVGITGFTPATDGTAVAADYNTYGSVLYSDDYYNTWVNAYRNYTFNAAGLANISKTGYTNVMFRSKWDITNDLTGLTWSSNKYATVSILSSEYSGTDKDPFITITYTTGGGAAPVASFTCTKNFLRIPNSVTCTDSSTNTPTSWSWNMGDGSAAKTTQNVTYPYMKRGIWGITLNATNAQGSNVTAASNVRVVGYENNG